MSESAYDPATEELLQFFSYEHLLPDLQEPSKACTELAFAIADHVPAGREKTAGLRKLLEAKDCFVRAVLADRNKKGG